MVSGAATGERTAMFFASRIVFSLALLCGIQPVSASLSAASEIDYLFAGVGMGTLNGTSFSGAFTASYVGDTNTVTSSPSLKQNVVTGKFAAVISGVQTTVNFTASNLISLNTDPMNTIANNIGFFQSNSTAFVGEVLVSPTLATYDLKSAFATTGTVSSGNQTYETDGGKLNFASISSLVFTASVPTVLGTPGPIAGAGMIPLLGLAGLYVSGRRRRTAA